MKKIALLLVFGLPWWSIAQQIQENGQQVKTIFERTWLFGFKVNNSWSNYAGTEDSSFYRPSLGIHLGFEYAPASFLQVSFGGGIQQRGMGIYTLDLDQSIGNPDSTGRLRYKCSTIDFPVEVAFRPTCDVFKNGRVRMAFGVTPSYIFKAQRIWKSVDDGFHESADVSSAFDKWDFPLRASLGVDVSVPGNVLFRVQGVAEYGLHELYSDPLTGRKSHKNRLIGLELAFWF